MIPLLTLPVAAVALAHRLRIELRELEAAEMREIVVAEHACLPQPSQQQDRNEASKRRHRPHEGVHQLGLQHQTDGAAV